MIDNKIGPYPDLDELFQEIHDGFYPKSKEQKIRVLVFGPDLSSTKPSSELRKYIIEKCREDSYIVVLTEHEEIQQLYQKIFRSASDLCKMEFHLASGNNGVQDYIDGIIIIPDSSGSFIELGMFTTEDSVHKKMLVLFNQDHASSMTSNFIGLGAKTAFDNGNAKTKLLDYNNNDAAWTEVSKFLDFIKGSKHWSSWKRNK